MENSKESYCSLAEKIEMDNREMLEYFASYREMNKYKEAPLEKIEMDNREILEYFASCREMNKYMKALLEKIKTYVIALVSKMKQI